MLPPPPEQPRLASDSERTRELELELRRVRAAATAARLEARAAEIELLLRRASRRPPESRGPSAVPASPVSAAPEFTLDRLPFDAWQDLVQAASPTPAPPPVVPSESPPARSERAGQRAAQEAAGLPIESSRSVPYVPHEERANEPPPQPSPKRTPKVPAKTAAKPPAKGQRVPAPTPRTAAPSGELDLPKFVFPQTPPVDKPREALAAATHGAGEPGEAGEAGDDAPRRKRPAAWIISTLAHAALLLLLAASTLSVAQPKDHIAIEAATSPAEELRIETVPLEQADQPEETATQTPLPLATEPSPIGIVAASHIEVDAPELMAPPTESLDSLSQLSAAATALTDGSPDLSSQFFGVDGGGNHFVYLVDNSGSMASIAKDGFDVARNELLASVAALKPDQRFYVIFFGEEMLRMRINDPREPEPRSVYATVENKEALRQWAMGITMQPGKWPEESLRFAFELRPDVIFLLTDGEMSQKVEPMIREHNLVESLFEGPRPRSIIHTIGFYSRDGAEQMRQIAATNGGTYRFVPPPPRQ